MLYIIVRLTLSRPRESEFLKKIFAALEYGGFKINLLSYLEFHQLS